MTQTGFHKTPVIAVGLFSFQIGGSERIGADVAAELRRRGYRIICFAFYGSDGPIRTDLQEQGVECVDLNYQTRPRWLRRLTYQWELWRFFRRHRVTALHVHHATSLILSAIPAILARVPRIVMTEHSLESMQARPRYRRQSKFYCRLADAVTVVHPTQAEYFRTALSFPQERLHYIPNGVDVRESLLAARDKTRQLLGIQPGEFVFMYAGRLQPVKDVGTLVEALAVLAGNGPDSFRAVIVGDGPERAMLEEKSQALNLAGRLMFLGERNDVRTLLTAADCFVMTSLSEGVPMALLEAMAARVPCVATSVGGIPELFSNGTGALVSPQRPQEIAAVLKRIMRDPREREQMIARGLQRVLDHHNLQRSVDRYEVLLTGASAR